MHLYTDKIKELLLQVSQGNEGAFEQLVRAYQAQLMKTAFLFVKSRTLSEEIVQDVFMKVWTARQQLTEMQDFNAWLFIVCRNHIMNCLSRMASERSVRLAWNKEIPPDSSDTDHKVRTSQMKDLLERAVLHLPEQQQKVFRLAREHYLTYEQIAIRLNLSPHTVRTHMTKALTKIREFLKANETSLVVLCLCHLIVLNKY